MADPASIFAQANQPTVAQINPLDLQNRAYETQGRLNALQQFGSQQALGQAYQQATGPDGTLDVNKLRSIIAANPRAALSAPQGNLDAQNLGSSQQSMAIKNLGLQNDALDSLSSLNGGAGPKFADVQQKLQQGLNQGWLMPHNANSVLTGMPTGDDPQSMATRLHMIQTMGQQLESAQQRLENTTGAPATQDNGQQVQPGMVGGRLGSNPGAFTPAGQATQVYPSRSQLAGRVQTGMNPDGSPIYGPSSNVTPPNLAGPAGTPSPLGTGRLPPALRNPANGPAAAPPMPQPGMDNGAPAGPPPAPVANNGNVTTGLGPAQTAAQSAGGTASASAFQGIADDGVKAQSQSAVLANMLADSSQFTAGPGAAGIKQFQAVLQRIGGPIGTSFGVDPGRVSAQESFDKLAAQLANAQGAGSDARLNVNQAANPHGDMSPAGVDLVIRQLQGNADYTQARAQLAAAYPDKANRPGFEASIGANLDPRTFQYQRLTPAQKTTYFNSLADKSSFIKAHDYATAHGLIGGNNAGQ